MTPLLPTSPPVQGKVQGTAPGFCQVLASLARRPYVSPKICSGPLSSRQRVSYKEISGAWRVFNRLSALGYW